MWIPSESFVRATYLLPLRTKESFACRSDKEVASALGSAVMLISTASLFDDLRDFLGSRLRWESVHGAREVRVPRTIEFFKQVHQLEKQIPSLRRL